MFVLTKHAKDQVKKRLLKKKSADLYEIWKSALEFAKRAMKIEDNKFIYFTNGKYTLVVVKKNPKLLTKEEALRLLKEIKREDFVVYKDGKLFKISKEKLIEILEDNVVISEYGNVYFGKPYMALTLRPAKVSERFRLFGKFSEEKKYDLIAVGIVTIPDVIFVIDKGYNAIYFPGGTVEPNEDEITALKRELKEELNLKLENVSKNYIETYVYSPKKNKYVLVKTYVGKVSGEIKIKKDEIEGVIIYPLELIDEEFLKWLNQKYLLGPSVIDVFIRKRKELEKIIKKF